MPNRYGEEDDRGTIFFSGGGSSVAVAQSYSFSFPLPFSFPSLGLSEWLGKPPVVAGRWKGALGTSVPFYRQLMAMAAGGRWMEGKGVCGG